MIVSMVALLRPVQLLQGKEGCCWRSNLWLKKKKIPSAAASLRAQSG